MKLAGSYTIAEALKDVARRPQHRRRRPPHRDPRRLVAGRRRDLARGRAHREGEAAHRLDGLATRRAAATTSPRRQRRSSPIPLTITGSIGIFYGKADVSELLDKIGVNVETYKTTPRADAESLFRPFTDDETRELQKKVKQFYDVFLDRVAEGRHMTHEAVDAVGQGRVWSGRGKPSSASSSTTSAALREALDEARRLGRSPGGRAHRRAAGTRGVAARPGAETRGS